MNSHKNNLTKKEFISRRPRLRNASRQVQDTAWQQHCEMTQHSNHQPSSGLRTQRSSVPIAYATVSKKVSPVQRHVGRDKVIISNTEIMDTVSLIDSPFNMSVSEVINPSNSSMFPWLSTLSQMYEFYNFKKLEFRWVSSTGSSTDGNVILVVDYDSTDATPTNLRDIMSYRNAMITNIWKNCVCTCDSKDLHRRKSYFTGLAGNDPNLQNTGKFFLATSAGQFIATAGYVEVDYIVEFETPQKYVAPSLKATISGNGPFGTSSVNTTSGGLAQLFERVSPTTANIRQAGKYLMSVSQLAGTNPVPGTLTSPNGNVTITQLDQVLNATSALTEYLLDVKIPHPTFDTLTDLAYTGGTGTDSSGTLRMVPYNII